MVKVVIDNEVVATKDNGEDDTLTISMDGKTLVATMREEQKDDEQVF